MDHNTLLEPIPCLISNSAALGEVGSPPPAHMFDPKPETAQFATELTQPEFVNQDGITFGVFHLNRQYEGTDLTPVVINLAHGGVAQSGAGRSSLNAFAQTIQSPLIVIDMAGMGSSGSVKASELAHVTFEKLAASHVAILNKLGVEQFDIIGYSMAGVMSAKMAELAGERVKHLVTFSALSFEPQTALYIYRETKDRNLKDFRRARAQAPPAVREELELSRQNRQIARQEMSTKAKAIAAVAMLKYATLMRNAHMSEMRQKLARSTKWEDYIGTDDPYSDWRLHLTEIRDRNSEYAHSSSLTLLGKETHSWLAVRRWEMAAMAATALEK